MSEGGEGRCLIVVHLVFDELCIVQLGSDESRGASVYTKDYEPASRSVTQKPVHVSRPRDSEVSG